jgi:hypothetical protein
MASRGRFSVVLGVIAWSAAPSMICWPAAVGRTRWWALEEAICS